MSYQHPYGRTNDLFQAIAASGIVGTVPLAALFLISPFTGWTTRRLLLRLAGHGLLKIDGEFAAIGGNMEIETATAPSLRELLGLSKVTDGFGGLVEFFPRVYPKRRGHDAVRLVWRQRSLDPYFEDIMGDVAWRLMHEPRWCTRTFVASPCRYLEERLWEQPRPYALSGVNDHDADLESPTASDDTEHPPIHIPDTLPEHDPDWRQEARDEGNDSRACDEAEPVARPPRTESTSQVVGPRAIAAPVLEIPVDYDLLRAMELAPDDGARWRILIAWQASRAALFRESSSPPGELVGVTTAAAFLEQPLKLPIPIVDGYIDAATKTMLVGPSKVGKTAFMLQMAICIATGRPFLGIPISKLKVLVVNMEVGDAFIQQRLGMAMEVIGAQKDELDGLSLYNGRGRPLSLCNDANVDRLIAAIKHGQFGVVILDPLYKLTEGDENLAHDVRPALLAMDRICVETGAAVVFTHHDAKGQVTDRQQIDRGAGSGIIARDFDTSIMLTPHKRSNHIVVEAICRNHATPESFTVELQQEPHLGLKRVELPPEARKSRRPRDGHGDAADSSQVLQIVSEPMKKGEAVDRLQKAGMTRRGANQVIERLIKDGRLATWEGGYPRSKLIGSPDAIIALEEGDHE